MNRCTILLIRGLFRSHFHWGNFPKQLAKVIPNAKIISLDLPGLGVLHSQASPSDIGGMVESLRTHVSDKTNLHIVAISMGGMIGLKWAELYPSEVKSLVCINTTVASLSPFYYRLRPSVYGKILRALFASSMQREMLIYSMISNQPLNYSLIEHWITIDENYPLKISNFFRQLYAALRFRMDHKPECPILTLSSINDKLVNTKATQALSNAWSVPVILNYWDGHDIPLDNPEWMSQLLVQWFDYLDSKTSRDQDSFHHKFE